MRAATAPAPVRAVTAFDPARIDTGIRAHLSELTTVELSDLARVRADTVATELTWDPAVRISSIAVPGPSGAGPVRVQLYDGRVGDGDTGAVLHLHGGAFVSGAPDFEHDRSTYLARGARCLVASVDYRLAPEHRYPAGLDDCAAAFDWLVEGAGELGVDARRIGVAGSSAGGCLAAALAQRGRDGVGPAAAFQLLVYPATDWRCATASMRRYGDVPGFCGRNAAQMWSLYLPDGAAPDPYASPALAPDLSGLPPVYVSVAELDPLRDEGIEYARRLIDADVPVELRVFPGVWHGFDLVAPSSRAAARFRDAEIGSLRRFLGLS